MHDSKKRTHSRFGRRESVKAGLAGTLSVLGRLSNSNAQLGGKSVQNEGIRKPKHRVIDVHCHPRWIGYNGARIIESLVNFSV